MYKIYIQRKDPLAPPPYLGISTVAEAEMEKKAIKPQAA
jgi:hypothetical protein